MRRGVPASTTKVGQTLQSVNNNCATNMNGDTGGTAQAPGRGETQVTKGNHASVVQGQSVSTVNGDRSDLITGMGEVAAESFMQIVGSFGLFNDGNAAASNQDVAPVAAVLAQKPEKKKDGFSMAGMLKDVSESISNATTSISKINTGVYAPTGDILLDIGNLLVYYERMMFTFTIKNTARRVLLSIKSQVEKMEKQFEETEKLLSRIPELWDRRLSEIKESVDYIFEPPSDEKAPKQTMMTKEKVVEAALGEDAAAGKGRKLRRV